MYLVYFQLESHIFSNTVRDVNRVNPSSFGLVVSVFGQFRLYFFWVK